MANIIKNKIKCTCCGEETAERNFYISKSFIYKATSHLPICKTCLGELYESYYEKYQDYKLAIYYMCRAVGICFNLGSYNAVLQEIQNGKTTNVWQIYMTKLNSLGSKNGAGDDFDSSDSIDIEAEIQSSGEERGLTKEIIRKWGNGYNDDDYVWLENTYNDWVSKYKSDTLSEQKTFKLLAIKEFQIMKTIEKNGNTNSFR
jgi:hypothetical protein